MNDQNKEVRKQKRLEQLGSNHPVCTTCGEDDWRCLELHHIAGKDHGKDLAPVCRNCHRKLSDDQKDHPSLIKTDNPLQPIGRFLLGLADLLALVVDTLRRFGNVLISSVMEKGDAAT